jgi:catechol 2,3-dioxygenase-like lactoylglutathione lyase family enzyme
MEITGIDHVQVAGPPGCEEAARGFYGGLLGLEEIPKPESLGGRGGCWFRAGQQQLHVGIEEPFVPARKAHPGFVACDIDAVAALLLAGGHEVTFDDTMPETRRFYVADPFGNRLEIRQC